MNNQITPFRVTRKLYDERLEKQVIGSLLTYVNAFDECFLTSEDFADPFWKRAFEFVKSRYDAKLPLDMVSIGNALNNKEACQRFVEASIEMPSKAYFQTHCQLLRQMTISRKLLEMTHNVQQAIEQDEDVGDIMESVETALGNLTFGIEIDANDMSATISDTMAYIRANQQRAMNGKSGIPTGFRTLDRTLNGGWREPQLIIVGGRPSMGKTSFAIHFAEQAALNNYHTLFVSIEMIKEQLGIKLLLEDSALNNYELLTGKHMTDDDWVKINNRVAELIDLNLHIADKADVRNLQTIKTLARKMRRRNQCDLLIIDYLQLIRTGQKFGTRDLEIGYITGELKNLAKELHIPVMLLAQLNRNAESNGKVTQPRLSDLRESGNIEQDADIVIFPHRPSYYDKDARDGSGNSWAGRGMLIVAKNREGERDVVVRFEHNDTFKKFWEEGTQVQTQPKERCEEAYYMDGKDDDFAPF